MLHRYLELVDKYTPSSPHLGVFLISVLESRTCKEDAVEVCLIPSGANPAPRSLTKWSTGSRFILLLHAASLACSLLQAPLTGVAFMQAAMRMFDGAWSSLPSCKQLPVTKDRRSECEHLDGILFSLKQLLELRVIEPHLGEGQCV
jgi:hypothetical protein